MASIHRPRRGSLAYSPRKRAKSHIPKFRSWPESKSESKLQDFAGYKVGMTHVILIDDVKYSMTEGSEISVPVTIIETPAIKVAALRAYSLTADGEKAVTEAWSMDLDEELSRRITMPINHNTEDALNKISKLIEDGEISDIRVIVYTMPKTIKGIPKKKPDLMETSISGDLSSKFEYAKSILGNQVSVSDIFKSGEIIDVAAITTGKGTQGAVKRWGINMQKNKHSRAGSVRQVGTLGPWHPAHVSWKVPQVGQMGYHQRTEFNKRILKISDNADEVNPNGGFINYGFINNEYILIKGSVPGPSKRLIRLRDPIRSKVEKMGVPNILHISTKSKQGC